MKVTGHTTRSTFDRYDIVDEEDARDVIRRLEAGAGPRGAWRRTDYASVLLMLGAHLVSVQKLLGHSDPKITERRYGHMLPDFMKSEVDRLRFGLDRLAPALPA